MHSFYHWQTISRFRNFSCLWHQRVIHCFPLYLFLSWSSDPASDSTVFHSGVKDGLLKNYNMQWRCESATMELLHLTCTVENILKKFKNVIFYDYFTESWTHKSCYLFQFSPWPQTAAVRCHIKSRNRFLEFFTRI